MLARFHSRMALWTIRFAVIVPAVLSLGWIVFEWGDCAIGLTQRGECAHVPQALGDVALLALLAGYLYALYLTPVLIVIGLVLEYLARRK